MNEFENHNQHERINRAMPLTEHDVLHDTGGATFTPDVNGLPEVSEYLRDASAASRIVLVKLGISQAVVENQLSDDLSSTNAGRLEEFIDQHYPLRQQSLYTVDFPMQETLPRLLDRYQKHYDAFAPSVQNRLWLQFTPQQLSSGSPNLQPALVLQDISVERPKPSRQPGNRLKEIMLDEGIDDRETEDPALFAGQPYRGLNQAAQDELIAQESAYAANHELDMHASSLAEFLAMIAIQQELGTFKPPMNGITARLPQLPTVESGKNHGLLKFLHSKRIATVGYNAGQLFLSSRYVDQSSAAPTPLRSLNITRLNSQRPQLKLV
jgi:hypothetical protein